MATKYTADVYSFDLVLEKPAKLFKIIGRNVPNDTATIRRQMYDTKKTYVEDRDRT